MGLIPRKVSLRMALQISEWGMEHLFPLMAQSRTGTVHSLLFLHSHTLQVAKHGGGSRRCLQVEADLQELLVGFYYFKPL